MIVGVPKEIKTAEHRVALVPAVGRVAGGRTGNACSVGAGRGDRLGVADEA